MPMGLINAPATFSRLMQACVKDEHLRTLVLYLDDILLFSTTWEGMLIRLDKIYHKLTDFGLKLKSRKCLFFKEKTMYLGDLISKEGIAPDP